MTLFWHKTSLKIEKDSYLSQNIWYFDKIKIFSKLKMSFCYFCQKKSVVGVVHNDLLFVQIGPQKTLFKRFYQLFSRTAGLQHKLLILISESPKIFHWKSVKKVKSLGQNLDQIRSNVINKQRNWYFNGFFFIFSINYTSTSKI